MGWFTLYLMGTDVFVISPLLPVIAEHYRLSVAGAGWGMTVFAVSYAGLAPFFGHYGDRHGRRPLLVTGLLTFAAANAATAWAPRFEFFLFARFIGGGAAAMISPTVYAVTGDLAPAHRRGAWLAFVGSGIFTSLWSSAPLGSLLGYHYGWRWVFIILAIVSLILMVGNAVILKSIVHVPRKAVSGLAPLVRDVSVTGLWATALYATYTYLGAGLKTVGHCNPSQIALGITIYGVGMVAGVLAGGALADRWGTRRTTFLACTSLCAASLVLRSTMPHFPTVLLALFSFSFTAALFFSSFQVYLADRHGQRRGAALAWNNSALYFGVTVGSFFGGLVLSRWGFLGIPLLSSASAALAAFWGDHVQNPLGA
jgi:predicted MFS family arabinose efflux permease